MKKFKFTINGNIYDVEISNVEDNNAQVTVNGSTFDVQIDRSIVQQKTPKLVRTQEVSQSESAKPKTNAPDVAKSGGTIKSPLPGTIIELHVRQGDKVSAGQVIITIEAMKMENRLHSDRDGVVQAINCTRGDTVMEGDILMVIGD